MAETKNFLLSLLLGTATAFGAYKTQIINSLFAIGTALISSIIIYFINRKIRKIWP
jgi:hypothetical protein